MPNDAVARAIAQRLPNSLIHPGTPDGKQPAKLIPLPGLSGTGIPPAMAEHFAREAGMPSSDVPQIIAEAIVSLIETDLDSAIVTNAELVALRARATALDETPGTTVTVTCRCGPQLLNVNAARAGVTVDGQALARRIGEVCTCGA